MHEWLTFNFGKSGPNSGMYTLARKWR